MIGMTQQSSSSRRQSRYHRTAHCTKAIAGRLVSKGSPELPLGKATLHEQSTADVMRSALQGHRPAVQAAL